MFVHAPALRRLATSSSAGRCSGRDRFNGSFVQLHALAANPD
jgi:hypothetical protein